MKRGQYCVSLDCRRWDSDPHYVAITGSRIPCVTNRRDGPEVTQHGYSRIVGVQRHCSAWRRYLAPCGSRWQDLGRRSLGLARRPAGFGGATVVRKPKARKQLLTGLRSEQAMRLEPTTFTLATCGPEGVNGLWPKA